ncbi:MAG TPA: MFS transporter [Dehalococcoidia bacterium]|nr:MFS transporter [Dehalococcoidia bacterium]
MALEPEPFPDEPDAKGKLLPLVAKAPFYGWWILLAMAMLRVVASGFGNNIRSLLVLPLEEEFGASRTEVSLMATGGSIAVAVTGPLGGWLMDRYGVRKVMLLSLIVTVAGYFLLSVTNALWQVIFVFTVPLGVAYNWAILNSGAPVLNNWFNRQKARALSLLNVGHGAGALLLPVMAFLITDMGWRPAMVVAGFILLAAGVITVVVTHNTPEEMGLTPDGDPEPSRTSSQPTTSSDGVTYRDAIRTLFFWAIAVGSACMLFINLSVVFHMVPIVGSRGETQGFGATLLSLQLFMTVPIVLVTAWGADRVDGTKVLVAMMGLTTIGVLVLIAADTLVVYVLAMTLLAFGGSNWPILWAVLGHKYGRRNYNAIRMSIYSVLILGMSAGPLLAGVSFDATGGYSLWLQILVGVGVAGVLTFVMAVRAARAPAFGA